MRESVSPEGPQSFLGITIRRSFTTGRFFLVYALVISCLLGIGLGSTAGQAFTAGFPVILPIFSIVGATGALGVFTNDRMKGVIEYLIAYGVSPRRQFTNVLTASFVLVSVILGISLGVSLALFFARGNILPETTALLLLIYTIPMSYASNAFATTVGMFWTALSSPRAGMNSPVGLAPFIGILPPVGTLGALVLIALAGGTVTTTTFLLVAGIAMGSVAVAVALLLSMTDRLLRRERLLSPI